MARSSTGTAAPDRPTAAAATAARIFSRRWSFMAPAPVRPGSRPRTASHRGRAGVLVAAVIQHSPRTLAELLLELGDRVGVTRQPVEPHFPRPGGRLVLRRATGQLAEDRILGRGKLRAQRPQLIEPDHLAVGPLRDFRHGLADLVRPRRRFLGRLRVLLQAVDFGGQPGVLDAGVDQVAQQQHGGDRRGRDPPPAAVRRGRGAARVQEVDGVRHVLQLGQERAEERREPAATCRRRGAAPRPGPSLPGDRSSSVGRPVAARAFAAKAACGSPAPQNTIDPIRRPPSRLSAAARVRWISVGRTRS